MALQPCRECGASVSTEAPFCPRCGVPQPARAIESPPTASQPAPAPAVDPAEAPSWHYIVGGVRHGPVTRSALLNLLRRGEIAPDTPVKSDAGMYWLPITRAPELTADVPPEMARAAEAQARPPAYRQRLRPTPAQPSPEDERNLRPARTLGHVVYALQAASFLNGITLIVGVVVNYAGRDSVRGTYVNSHFDWQISTFWVLLAWWVGAVAVSIIFGASLTALLLVYLPSVPWLLYRVVHGWIRLNGDEPI